MVTLTFNQLATLMNALFTQATGQAAITPQNDYEFISMATTTLSTGTDAVSQAISQVLGKTIFSVRPYNRKFGGLQASEQKWGYITRKLNIVDTAFENDERNTLTDGQSIDMYKVSKPKVLQTNFYGTNVIQKHVTIYKDQLDAAFKSADEFGRFITMVTQNVSDMWEQEYETAARNLVCNLIAGRTLSQPTGGIIHLLTEYNTATGQSLTGTTVMLPANYPAYMQWCYARIAKACAMLTERTIMHHVNITNSEVARHTPYDRQHIYMLADQRYGMDARVLADTYHDNYLKYSDVETVNFWQAARTPSQIQCKPCYLTAAGTVTDAATAQTVTDIFGVIVDDETIGYTIMNEWDANTPLNAAGGYYNWYQHKTVRWWQDDTENAIVLLND